MIYIIITTSIFNINGGNADLQHRQFRYMNSIQHLLQLIQNDASVRTPELRSSVGVRGITGEDLSSKVIIKPIIVENNGLGRSYLDDLHCDVCYTNNNQFRGGNKGVNELLDIKEVIQKYNIQDDDVIIKLTGRYKLLDVSFIHLIQKNMDNYDAFIKFFNVCTKQFMFNDCVLGLFSIKCKYIKDFHYDCIASPEVEFAEYVRKTIQNDRIMEVQTLNLECCFADDLRILVV